ncbi:MAG: ExeM/NucH family extracellular endonuclease [Anaerolineaceae bacterium]|nr:MAG: ExeM/NucH family extracellular endonuclease [Anaerolineaceae bacterium]
MREVMFTQSRSRGGLIIACMAALVLLASAGGLFSPPAETQASPPNLPITSWHFFSQTTEPTSGTGTARAGDNLEGASFVSSGTWTRAWQHRNWSQEEVIGAEQYVEFSIDATGYGDISVDVHLRSSLAMDFILYYSIDGENFTALPDTQHTSPGGSYNVYNFDFADVPLMNDRETLAFRVYGYNAQSDAATLGIDYFEIYGTTGFTAIQPADPPAVSSTQPLDGALDVPITAALTLNFEPAVDIAADAFALVCDGLAVTLDAPTGAALESATLTPSASLPHGAVCTLTARADRIGNADGQLNGGDDHQITFSTTADPFGACDDSATAIQSLNPPADDIVIQGVVIGDYQGAGGLGGFYVQDSGDDPTRSDGVFVYTGADSVTISAGDVVRLMGAARVVDGQRQIEPERVTVCASGQALPEAVTVSLPFDSADYLERYVGMLVTFPQDLTVTDAFLLGRHGELTLAYGDRLYQPTQVTTAGADAAALRAANDLNRLIIDDASLTQNPDPIIFPLPHGLSAADTVRAGDTVRGVVGVLTYTAGRIGAAGTLDYRLRPHLSAPAWTFTASNPRPTSPPDVGGRLTVATYNVLNYFITLDGGAAVCGASGTLGCRGAQTPEELTRQEQKLVAALVAINADVVGLVELENPRVGDPSAALARLVAALNDATGATTYAYIDTGTIGGDAIKNGLIYQPDAVTPIGPFAVLDDQDPFTRNTRPPLAQVFEENATGERFMVVVNHFKAKSGCPADGHPHHAGNADSGDGQACWNADRVLAAGVLVDWLDELTATTGVGRVLLMGDLNAYANEDPLRLLADNGYQNLMSSSSGYSFAFDGEWGTLDYVLANSIIAGEITGAAHWHINADEPPVLDYRTSFKSAAQIVSLYDATPYRSSDHDPMLVGLSLTPTPAVQNGDSAEDGIAALYTGAVENLRVAFNMAVFDDPTNPDHPDNASNPNNYMLLSADDADEPTCADIIATDGERLHPAVVVYAPDEHASTLTFAPPLEDGDYVLLVCGTTSIVSAQNPQIRLNGGADWRISFRVQTAAPVDSASGADSADAMTAGDRPASAAEIDAEQPQPEALGISQLPATGQSPSQYQRVLTLLLDRGGRVGLSIAPR